MANFLTLLVYSSALVLGCSGKVGADANPSSAGGSGGPGLGFGGYGPIGGGGVSAGSSSLIGGKSIATPDVIDQIDISACAGVDVAVDPVPMAFQFVIDVSGSMLDVPPGSTGASKWEITKAALSSVILNNLPATAGVGILMYPNMSTVPNSNDTLNPLVELPVDSCVKTSAILPLAPLGAASSQQRSSIEQALATALVAGGTPTDDAFEYGYGNGLLPGMAKYSYYSPAMVLITDGQPTISLGCAGAGSSQKPSDWQPIVDYISTINGETRSAKTLVVGLPGSEAQSFTSTDGRQWLSMAARLGGTPLTPDCQDTGPNYCHLDLSLSVDVATDLLRALEDINRPVLSCGFKIPSPVGGSLPDPTQTSVIYEQNVVGGTPSQVWLIGETSDPTCANGTADGWHMDQTDSTGTTLSLCPTTCKAIQADKYGSVFVRQGCRTIKGGPV